LTSGSSGSAEGISTFQNVREFELRGRSCV
jgi:hypothetical protein